MPVNSKYLDVSFCPASSVPDGGCLYVLALLWSRLQFRVGRAGTARSPPHSLPGFKLGSALAMTSWNGIRPVIINRKTFFSRADVESSGDRVARQKGEAEKREPHLPHRRLHKSRLSRSTRCCCGAAGISFPERSRADIS